MKTGRTPSDMRRARTSSSPQRQRRAMRASETPSCLSSRSASASRPSSPRAAASSSRATRRASSWQNQGCTLLSTESASGSSPSRRRPSSASKRSQAGVVSSPSLARIAIELARAHGLAVGLVEAAADAHRLADRLHLRRQRLVGAGELLEREARSLDDDVVDRRLERGRRRARDVVGDLVQRVADREPGGDLRDRVARRLGRQRGRAGDARVHLDHDDLAALAVDRELHVGAAGLDADRADHLRGCVAQRLVLAVGERHGGRAADRIAGVHAHRIEVLDRADDHDVVEPVADHLQLELAPALDRLLDEHLRDRALGQAAGDDRLELFRRARESAAVAAERERGPDRDGQLQVAADHLARLLRRAHDHRARHAQADGRHRLPERLAVLGRVDGPGGGADQLDLELGRARRPARAPWRG